MTAVRVARAAVAVTFSFATLLMWQPAPGLAHEDEAESGKSGDLVRQAIALIVNTPDDLEAIQDKIDDATKAKDPSGVDLALVARAETAFEDGDLHKTRALLEQSIGAQPHLNVDAAEPRPIRETTPTTTAPTGTATVETDERAAGANPPMTMATGDAPGTELIAEPLVARPHLDGEDWTLLVASLVVGLAGVWLGLRYRPNRVKAP